MGTQVTPIAALLKQPQINTPLENLGQLLQTRDVASQIKLRQAQTEQANQQAENIAAEAAQRNKDQADQNLIQQSYKDPKVSLQLHAGDFTPLEGKVQPKVLDALRSAQLDRESKIAANTEQEQKIQRDALAKINEAGVGLLSRVDKDGKPDLAAINASLPSTLANLQDAFKQAKINPANVPSHLDSIDQLHDFLTSTGGEVAARDKVISVAAAKAAADKAAADATIRQGQATNQTPGGLLPDEAAKAAQAAADAAETKRSDLAKEAETARNNRAANAVAQGHLSIANKEFNAKYGEGQIQAWVDQVKKNPEVMDQLPAEAKLAVGGRLVAQGQSIPAKLGEALKQQEANSHIALDHIDRMEKMIEDPDLANSMGPIMGRIAKGESHLGTDILSGDPVIARKQQNFLTSLNYLFAREGKALFGGRAPQKLMQDLEKNSANANMSKDFLKGALDAARGSAETTVRATNAFRYGGSGTTPEAQALQGGSEVTTQEQFNALPSGAIYTENGKKFRKP